MDRLERRIDELAKQVARPAEPSVEVWIVEGDKTWRMGASEHEAEAFRPGVAGRLEILLVHADMGKAAACCSPGGACYLMHAPFWPHRPRPSLTSQHRGGG